MRDRREPSLPRARRLWWCLFGLWFIALGAWTFELPLLAGTDEASHATRAAAVVRGQLVGEARVIGDNGGFALVDVPEAYRNSGANCFTRDPKLTPACSPEFTGGSRLVTRPTNQYRAPPVYYAVVGLPTLLFPASTGVYLMRLLNAIASAAFLASAVLSALELRCRRLAVAGVLVAATPAVLYLGGSVNSNGLEVAASIALWCALLAIIRVPADPTHRLVARVGTAFVVLVLTRGMSPLFAVLAVVTVVCLGRRDNLARLVARSDVRRWLVVAAGSLAVAAAWLAYVRLEYPLERQGSGLVHAIGQSPTFLLQAVGVFNFSFPRVFELHDIPLPWTVYACWAVATIALLAAAFATARRREGLVLGAVVAVALVIPVLVEGLSFPPIGVFWVGRHGLPVLAGIPIVAAAITSASSPSRRRLISRIGVAIPCLVAVAQIVAFAATVRRWAVGSGGPQNPIDYLLHPRWSPPIPSSMLLLLFGASMCGLAGFAIKASRDDPTRIHPDADRRAPTPSPTRDQAAS